MATTSAPALNFAILALAAIVWLAGAACAFIERSPKLDRAAGVALYGFGAIMLVGGIYGMLSAIVWTLRAIF
ncbi:hypothetical protein [Mesorhizobium huakuii]|uniref:Uncharacterized protein n=1 Tax=Mesorhizobium huakuii TaxID=28104 RepID=A0A7G6T0M2_9HYPH|nr:hypothetical protein [Mesorhizobium huakuii]QND60304.1 hypothetical protein HB778_29975 [Mesorhizobium huakuii]